MTPHLYLIYYEPLANNNMPYLVYCTGLVGERSECWQCFTLLYLLAYIVLVTYTGLSLLTYSYLLGLLSYCLLILSYSIVLLLVLAEFILLRVSAAK